MSKVSPGFVREFLTDAYSDQILREEQAAGALREELDSIAEREALELPERRCTCTHHDAQACYFERNGLDHWEDQQEDLGECECGCHEDTARW